jgi:energy-coupling factor transport system substrate-specific component
MQKKSMWVFGTREVVYAAIGAALYAVLAIATNFLQLPSSANVSIRPAVAIPMFFGIAFGPLVGLISGVVGNIIGDVLSGYGFWPWWDLGNGLMGLVPGLIWLTIVNFKSTKDIVKAEIAVVVGAFVGMFVASLSEIWVSGIDFATTMATNFMPAFISNIINGLILVPILMIAYAAIVARSGR